MFDSSKFKIRNHHLETEDGERVSYIKSPNQGGAFNPRYLIMHYTAGRSAESSIDWLTDKRARASAHIVIGRDGDVTQLVRFDRKAWHAGKSEWKGRKGMSKFSIGIELDNAGRLTKRSDKWYSWFNGEYPEEDVVVATHKHHTNPSGWHSFTTIQLQVAAKVAIALVHKYDLLDVIGHDDVSPIRKIDPGPAFPMESFRSMVMGREEDEEDVYETTTSLNIRLGPGTEFETLESSPLPPDTQVIILNTHLYWNFVEVVHELGEDGCGVRGWVSGRYLRRIAIDMS